MSHRRASGVASRCSRKLTHAAVGLEARPVEVEAHRSRRRHIVGLPDKACNEARERVRSGVTSAELEWLSGASRSTSPRAWPREGRLRLRPPDRARDPGRPRQVLSERLGWSRCPGRARARRAPAAKALSLAWRPDGTLHGRAEDPVRGRVGRRGGARRRRAGRAPASRRSGRVPSASLVLPPVEPPGRSPRPAYPDLADARARASTSRSSSQPQGATTCCSPSAGMGDDAHDARPPGFPAAAPEASTSRASTRRRAAAQAGRSSAGLRSAPHHTASAAATVHGGGGRDGRPGEVSLAHHGIRCSTSCPSSTEPSSRPYASRSRTGRSASRALPAAPLYPARFLAVATMNLCRAARAAIPPPPARTTQRISTYRTRLSRALLDRFDLTLLIPRPARASRPSAGRALDRGGRAAASASARLSARPPSFSAAAGELLDRARPPRCRAVGR